MSQPPPPSQPPSGQPSQGYPTGGYPPPYSSPMPGYPAPEGRSVSFFVALFLGLLLLISGAINVVLVLFSAIGDTSSFDTTDVESDAGYKVVAVSGAKSKDKILRISIDGAIAESASPVMGAEGGTVTRVRRQLRLAGREPSIKGVLLAINSPGGGVTDSDEIHRMIKEFRDEKKKPVVAYFGDMSASGGYYVAAACDRIYCRPTTITGSIGVIMSHYDLGEAFKKLGIESNPIVSPHTPYKDIMSMSRPMTDEERGILLSIIDEMYQRFVSIVDEGRPELDRDAVMRLANGQIYSANQAKANGLVDDILSPDEVVGKIEKLANVERAQLVEQQRLPTLMETMFGAPGARAPDLGEAAARFLDRTTGARLLYFWPGGR